MDVMSVTGAGYFPLLGLSLHFGKMEAIFTTFLGLWWELLQIGEVFTSKPMELKGQDRSLAESFQDPSDVLVRSFVVCKLDASQIALFCCKEALLSGINEVS